MLCTCTFFLPLHFCGVEQSLFGFFLDFVVIAYTLLLFFNIACTLLLFSNWVDLVLGRILKQAEVTWTRSGACCSEALSAIHQCLVLSFQCLLCTFALITVVTSKSVVSVLLQLWLDEYCSVNLI